MSVADNFVSIIPRSEIGILFDKLDFSNEVL